MNEMNAEASTEDYLNKVRQDIAPLFVYDEGKIKLNRLVKQFTDIYRPREFSSEYNTRTKAHKFKFTTYTDYNQFIKYAKEHQFPFHLTQQPHERTLKVVIKGLYPTMTPEEVMTELTEVGHEVTRVTQIYSHRWKTLVPIFLVDLPNNTNSLNIYNTRTLCHCKIKVEEYRKPFMPPQCNKCQRFRHLAKHCQAPDTCSRCSGPHHISQCQSQTFKCALCKQEGHGARYSGCPVRQQLLHNLRSQQPPQSQSRHAQHTNTQTARTQNVQHTRYTQRTTAHFNRFAPLAHTQETQYTQQHDHTASQQPPNYRPLTQNHRTRHQASTHKQQKHTQNNTQYTSETRQHNTQRQTTQNKNHTTHHYTGTSQQSSTSRYTANRPNTHNTQYSTQPHYTNQHNNPPEFSADDYAEMLAGMMDVRRKGVTWIHVVRAAETLLKCIIQNHTKNIYLDF